MALQPAVLNVIHNSGKIFWLQPNNTFFIAVFQIYSVLKLSVILLKCLCLRILAHN